MKDRIEITKLYKTFQNGNTEVDVLKNISFTVKDGEFLSVMGPSGSGKSTLLYIMGGLDKPTSGTIKLNNKDLTSLKDKEESSIRRNDIGFVFQFYNLIPNLTVEENVMLPILLDNKNCKKYKEQLEEVLNDVGLYERKSFRPKELSGGQQQRVAIARALINSPDLILADEPIGNLDSKVGMSIMELLRELNVKKKKTIVQVTHSKEASFFGNRIIYLKDGIIEKDEII